MQVIKTYSGKVGCMCGCLGKWNYTAYGVLNHNPGYAVEANERGAKIIASKVLKHPDVQVEEHGDGTTMYFVEQGDRFQAVIVE